MPGHRTSGERAVAAQHARRGGVVALMLMLMLMLTGPWRTVLAATGPSDAVQARSAEASALHGAHPLDMTQANVLHEPCLLPDLERGPPPPDAAPWLHLRLPHLWQDTHPGFEGAMWYRFRVRMAKRPDGAWAVYLPRVVMNAQVWVNGVALDYSGSMADPVTRHWYVPLLVHVPATLWQTGENVIHVRVASGYQSRNGLAPIQVGPVEPLVQAYKQRRWAQVDAVQIAHVALITLGLLMVVVWMRDRAQSTFGFMGVSALFWGLSTLMLISPYPLTDVVLWERLTYIATVWYQLALCAFFFRFAERRWLWVDRGVAALAVLLPLYYCVAPDYASTAWIYAGIYALALCGMGVAGWHVLRGRRPDGHWLIVGCAFLVPAATHDVMIQMRALPFDAVYWLPLMGPLMIASTFVILAGDYARSRTALHELNQDLASRVARRERELRASFERLAALESAQAVSAERSRILRDMHDGVGAHLTSALRQLQAVPQQAVDVPLVTQTLRDSLDQLKLSIDAMSLQPGDVVGLLASWRFRLTPRLKAAGMELVWDVDELPPWPGGQPPALRQLQYILFEGLSNVLQHSGATRLVLSARAGADHLRVSLIDNGRGWTGVAHGASGQGLQTMQGRADSIGARVEFLAPAQGGLELRLTLPLHEAAESGLSSAA